MKEQEELIKRLSFENFIWAIYIVIAVFNIYGDELIKKSIRNNDQEADKTAKKIFLVIFLITALIYLYFLLRNYNDLKKHFMDEEYYVRFVGSVLTFSGILCFLYFQIAISREADTVSSI